MEVAHITLGRHPEYGIVARNSRELPVGEWMLDRLDFRPVPGHPRLYALTGHPGDSQAHTARAVATLRKAGYTVEADAEFEPATPAPARQIHHRPAVAPDVAFAEHPQLGVVAALDGHDPCLGGELLESHGWRHNPSLDIYILPSTTRRGDALDRVAAAVQGMQRVGLLVAVGPRLTRDVLRHRAEQAYHRVGDHALAAGRHPITTAALARSPAVSPLPEAPPATATAEAAARPVDPRIAFSRPR